MPDACPKHRYTPRKYVQDRFGQLPTTLIERAYLEDHSGHELLCRSRVLTGNIGNCSTEGCRQRRIGRFPEPFSRNSESTGGGDY